MEVITGNVKLYKEHQPIVDALAQEAHHLREELLHFSEAFKKMNLSDPDGALLRIFARDLHAAHQEFMSRLSFLADNAVSSKDADAAQANEKKERALKEIDKLNAELAEKKKDLQKKEEKITSQTEEIASFKRKLNGLLKAVETKTVWPNSGIGVLATLQQFGEWYKGDCKRIEDNLKKVKESIEAIDGYKGEVQKCIDGIKAHADEWNKILSRSRYDDVISIIDNDVPTPMVAIDEEKENLRSLSEAISNDKEEIEKKTERLKSLVKKKSEISRLIEFLNNEL